MRSMISFYYEIFYFLIKMRNGIFDLSVDFAFCIKIFYACLDIFY